MSSPRQQRRGIEPRHLVTIIEANDVLLGRGNHVHNPGNAKFRMLVLARSIEYWSCNNNVTKDSIARQIIDQVSSLGGRFLRKFKQTPTGVNRTYDADASGSSLDDPTPLVSNVWELADMETILVKVKQTFRDFTASAKKKTSATSLPERSQHSVPHSSLIRQSSNQLLESNETSNILKHANTETASTLELKRPENNLLSSGILPNVDTERVIPSTLRTDERDLLYPNTGIRALERLHDEINHTIAGELLTRQRNIASWQELLRQQQIVSESNVLLNHHRNRGDQALLLQQNNNTLQDQILLRRFLLQSTPAQSDLPTFARVINQQRESLIFPPNDALMLNSTLPLNTSNPHQFLQTLDELHRAQRQQNQQFRGNMDLHNAASTLYQTSPHYIDTNVLRQVAAAPAHDPNDRNYLNVALANEIARQNLMSNIRTGASQPSPDIHKNSVDDEDDDDDKKPPGRNK